MQYDMRSYFNVRSMADISQFNLRCRAKNLSVANTHRLYLQFVILITDTWHVKCCIIIIVSISLELHV